VRSAAPRPPQGPVLAIDPGRHKCGLAVVDQQGRPLHQAVVPTREVGAVAASLVAEHAVAHLLVGDRTAAREVCRLLAAAGLPLAPTLVDEHHSSEQARRRFFQENPPRGWRRLLPTSLQTPSRPCDDYVALLLAERFLAEPPAAD